MLLDNPSALRDQYSQALFDDVMPFWLRHSLDPEYGGYLTCLQRDGAVYDGMKNVWLQGRQVWMLSKLHNCEGARPGYLEAAASGARFLREHGRGENGDWFLALDRRGEPIDGARDFFSGCFAALGLGEYSSASGETWAAELAVRTFAHAEQAARTGRIPLNELAPEDSSLLSLSVPMILINLATELGEAVPGCGVTPTLRRALELVMTKFVDRWAGLVYERVSPDGSHPDTPTAG